MEYTPEEVVTRALRLIGVMASDETATDDQMQAGQAVLGSIFMELRQEAQPTWDIATGTPSEAFVALSHWLGAELAGEYGVASPMSRGRAKLRVLTIVRPDDRTDEDWAEDYGMILP